MLQAYIVKFYRNFSFFFFFNYQNSVLSFEVPFSSVRPAYGVLCVLLLLMWLGALCLHVKCCLPVCGDVEAFGENLSIEPVV